MLRALSTPVEESFNISDTEIRTQIQIAQMEPAYDTQQLLFHRLHYKTLPYLRYYKHMSPQSIVRRDTEVVWGHKQQLCVSSALV